MSYGSGGYGSGGYGSGNSNSGGYGYSGDDNSNGYGYSGDDNSDGYGYSGGSNSSSDYGNSDYPTGNGGGTPDAKANGRCNYIEGIISGYEVRPDHTGFLMAWLKSLFLGIPCAIKSEEHVFQLVKEEFGYDGACEEVHLIGEIATGRLNNGERVQVYGSKMLNGAYLARKIYKTNNGMRVTIRNAMPAFLVRLITIFFIIVIAGVISAMTDLGNQVVDATQNMGTYAASSGSSKLIIAGIVILLVAVLINRIRSWTGIPIKILWIIAAVIVALIVPEVGATIITICIVIWLIKLLFGIR